MLDDWFHDAIIKLSQNNECNKMLIDLHNDYRNEFLIYRYSSSYINKIYKQIAIDFIKNLSK